MRVLIATVTAGGGHLQAASALEETWRNLRPSDQVEKVDLLDFVPQLQRKAYAEGFLMLVAHAPELWSLVFKKTDHPALLRKLTRSTGLSSYFFQLASISSSVRPLVSGIQNITKTRLARLKTP